MKKRIISIILCFVFCFISLSPCFVSAAFSPSLYPELSSYSEELTSAYVDDFYSNSSIVSHGFTRDNSVFLFYKNCLICFLTDNISETVIVHNGVSYSCLYVSSGPCIYAYNVYPSSFGSFSFTLFNNFASYTPLICKGDNFYFTNVSYTSSSLQFMQSPPSSYPDFLFFNGYIPPYVPDYNLLVGFPVSFQFNEQDFYNWIIDNNKLPELPSYITSSKLLSFLSFYKQFGSSNSSFVTRIFSWFSHMNIANQSNENIVILKNAIDKLYQEYINQYKHEFYSNSANQAHHRRNVNTQTTDDNLTLVTDDSNDDIYTTLLREIIRGIVALQSNIVSGLRAVIDTLNNLDFTVNVSNNGGVSFDGNSIWGTGDITQSENYLALTSAFMDKGVDVSVAENMKINYLDNATQQDSFTVSVVMPDQYINGQFTEKTITHTIDNTSKMYNTLLLFRKLIAFAVIAYFAIRIRFELPNLIRGE